MYKKVITIHDYDLLVRRHQDNDSRYRLEFWRQDFTIKKIKITIRDKY